MLLSKRIEDIIDNFTLEVESKITQKKKRGLLQRFKRYAAFPSDLKSRHKIGTEIKGLKAKINHIKEGRERYGLVNLGDQTSPLADETLRARRRIHSHDNNTLVVGLDVHMKEIADRLLNPNVKRRCVVSIVGIGGIGKTTLANKVFNDHEIKAKFNAFACISVSQDFKVFEIYEELARQMMGKTMAELQSCAMVEMSEMLREFLLQRRYLIVLDDVWREDVWDRLIREALPEVKNGSRVLLTTRNMDLATSIDPTIPPYELPFLNEHDSWALFLNKAFLSYQEESSCRCPEELEEIGRSLVKRCGGLPLALEVLGGILSSKTPNSVAWKSVAEHFDWGSTDKKGDCSKILGISYDNLPHHHLKSCFLYLGVFPEDKVIDAQQLVELWIAEGFVPQLDTQILMEDTAYDYLEELAGRSMIQVVHKYWLGSSATGVKKFRIHDLFRDLCIREAREDNFFNIYNTSNSSTTGLQDTINIHGKNLRRLVIHGNISTTTADCTVKDFMPPRNLKSILQFGSATAENPSIIIPNGLKLLRVIHYVGLEDRPGLKVPEMFSKMITNTRHLQYLRLYGESDIGSLVRNLCNLQTLHLNVGEVSVLPDRLGEIRTLRHLYLKKYGYSLIPVSCLGDVGSLTNLITLRAKMDVRGLIERGVMEKLVNIRRLTVALNHLEEEEQVLVFIDSLRKMKHLSDLTVCIEEGMIPIELILSGLSEITHLREIWLLGPMSMHGIGIGFPPNLTYLLLEESELAQDPMTILEKLPYLKNLRLHHNAYIGKEMVCTSGGFPRLQDLYLFDLTELEEWRIEDRAMPNLTSLEIYNCTKLKALPEGLQHLRSLKTLVLY